MGVVVTSPLEVVKKRFQSSGGQNLNLTISSTRSVSTAAGAGEGEGLVRYFRIWSTLSHIVMEEGVAGLFKGLGPTLLGKVLLKRHVNFHSSSLVLVLNSFFLI